MICGSNIYNLVGSKIVLGKNVFPDLLPLQYTEVSKNISCPYICWSPVGLNEADYRIWVGSLERRLLMARNNVNIVMIMISVPLFSGREY